MNTRRCTCGADRTGPSAEAHDVDCPAADIFTPTKRQAEVLDLIALGMANKAIAHKLHISVETVKEHIHIILSGAGFNSRTAAAVWWIAYKFRSKLNSSWPNPRPAFNFVNEVLSGNPILGNELQDSCENSGNPVPQGTGSSEVPS